MRSPKFFAGDPTDRGGRYPSKILLPGLVTDATVSKTVYMATKTTTVGIFDNARDLEKAVERLARAGFEDTVYDEGIVAGEAVNVGPAVFAPGYAPAVVWGSAQADSSPKPDHDTIVRAFKAHLAEYHLPKEVIKAYATTFYHNGEFLLVKTNAEQAGQVMKILQDCGATRVNRHD